MNQNIITPDHYAVGSLCDAYTGNTSESAVSDHMWNIGNISTKTFSTREENAALFIQHLLRQQFTSKWNRIMLKKQEEEDIVFDLIQLKMET